VEARLTVRVRCRLRGRGRGGVWSRSSTCLTLSDCRVHAPFVCSMDLDSKRMSAMSPSMSVFKALQNAETATGVQGVGLVRGGYLVAVPWHRNRGR